MLSAIKICIAYIIGILWGLYLDIRLGMVSFFLSICVILGIKFYEELVNKKFKWIYSFKFKIENKVIYVMLICFVLGMFYSNIRLQNFENKYDIGYIYLKGEVLNKIEVGSYYTKYLFKDESGKDFLLYIKSDYHLDENSLISLQGIFEKPSKQRNSGGFDYSKYLYSQNIYGSIYINNCENIEILETQKFHLISKIQNNILNTLGTFLPSEHLGILLGMIIGDTSFISKEIEESFKESGITHLLAVSGSNVAYVILVTKFLFQKLIGKSFSNWITIVTIILFILISGASPSVVRAGLMAILLIFSEILSRQPNVYSTIATTAILILLYNPLIICDIGFILSFGGTLGIILFSSKIQNQIIECKNIQKLLKTKYSSIFNTLIEMFSVTLSAQLFLAPIMGYFFNQISFISILTNLIVGSFTGIITVLGICLCFLGNISFSLAQILSYSIYSLISFLIVVSKFCARYSWWKCNDFYTIFFRNYYILFNFILCF